MSSINNQIDDLRGFSSGLAGATLREAALYVIRGMPHGAQLLSAPTDSTFRAWAWIYQLALLLVLVGTVLLSAVEGTLALVVGGGFAALGLLVLVVAFVMCAAIERTVPPPRHVVSAAGDPFRPHDAHTGLLPLADGVWVAQIPLDFYGMHIGTRMTVFDTGDGLLVYSPVDADDALFDAVRALGTVRWIVAPNLLHHLFVGLWHETFPEAELWAAPGLPERRADLPWTGTLHTAADAPWDRTVVDLALLSGHPLLTEVVVIHRPTRTLALCDMIQDLGHDPELLSPNQRVLLQLGMSLQRASPPVDHKLGVTDRAALRAAIVGVLQWDIDRIVIAHGPIVRERAWAVLADAFAFVR